MIELLCLSVVKTIGKLKQGSLNNKIARANAQCMQEIVPQNFLLELSQLPSLVSVQSQSKVRFIEFQYPKRKGGFLFVPSSSNFQDFVLSQLSIIPVNIAGLPCFMYRSTNASFDSWWTRSIVHSSNFCLLICSVIRLK